MSRCLSDHGEVNPKRKRGAGLRRIPRLRFGLLFQLVLLSLLAVCTLASAAKPQSDGTARSPNIIFILADDK